ncbi:PIH1 domain-containing protein 1 [Biomphalaria glabrata]|nr:PIH1 domain-containing protein 1 [Biomphalaria glabrata]
MDSSLLDAEEKDNTLTLQNEFLRHLLLTQDSMKQEKSAGGQEGIPTVVIKPCPGMCMKTRTVNGEKVFINICYSENVPEPKDLTDDELLKVLESEDPTKFRIPMSIGEPHAELDKSGGGCTVYDVVINPNFFNKINTSELFKTFFLTIMCEGIESKYDVLLKRDWIFLKNRKSLGKLAEQHIRTKSTPLIVDMESTNQLPAEQPEKKNLIEEIQKQDEELNKKAPEPIFSIIQEPVEGYPEYLVAEISLPEIKTAQSVTLKLGEDRLLLTTRSHVYYMDIFLPYDLVQDDCGAQFDKESKVLTVTMPVKPKEIVQQI